MATDQIDVDMGDCLKKTTFTVNLTGLHKVKIRLWLAIRLFALGARILGSRIKFEVVETKGEGS